MSPRILIDPVQLREAARTYLAIGSSLQGIRGGLRAPIPDMPGDLRALVEHDIADAIRDVGEQDGYLAEEATSLLRRAEWAEKADRGGWSSLLSLFDLFGLGGVAALSDRFGQPSRPDLDAVLRDYQVADDGVTEWEPSGIFGWFTDARTVTSTEAELLDTLGIGDLSDFKDAYDGAFAESGERYGGITPYDKNDGQEDAFRHAYWNALLTAKFGEEFARKYATAHEGLPGNPGPREAMDLYNNEVGRQIAVEHPDADDDELARLIQDAVDKGNLVVIDADVHLAFSDEVPVGHHGDASEAPPIGAGAPAEGPDPEDEYDPPGTPSADTGS